MLFGHDEGKNLKQLCNGEKDVICVGMGGTGADNKKDARENLDIADAIIETGTDDAGIWKYEKYASGRYKAWCLMEDLKTGELTATGANYYGSVDVATLPSFHTGLEDLQITLEASQYAWLSRAYVSNKVVKADVLRSVSPAPTMNVRVTLTGRYD